jgi:hypothetical protein
MELRGSSTGGSGPDLTGYPHLTYAPAQWGEGVRIASNGINAAALVVEGAMILNAIDDFAAQNGVTLAELFDAIRYARDSGAV